MRDPVSARPPTDPVLFITYAWDDPDEANVLDVSPTLKQAREWMRGRGEGYCYRVERLPDGAYGNESFVEIINPVASEGRDRETDTK